MENEPISSNSFHFLVNNLSPNEKAVLIHVVEVHDEFCKRCQTHRQNKNNVTVSAETEESLYTDVNTSQEEQTSKASKNGDIDDNDKQIPDHLPESSDHESDTIPLQMDVEPEDESGNECEQHLDTESPNRKGPDGNQDDTETSEDLHSDKCSEGNLKKMKWSIKVFKLWLIQNGKRSDFEYMDFDETLNHLHQMALTRTIKNGDKYQEYSVNKMNMIKSHIIHYVKSKPFNRRQTERMSAANRRELGNILKMTSENNYETPLEETSLKNVLSQIELRKIYESGVFGDGENYTPRSLLCKVWFEIVLHFGNFLKRSSWRLLREEMKIATDEKGRLFCTFCLNDMCETRWMKAPRIYSTPGNPFCPLKSILLYISHLNPNNELLFQQPVRFKSARGEWYTGKNLGKNTLKTMMKVISKNAGLDILYPNICIRDTEYTILNHAGIWRPEEYERQWKRGMEFDIGQKKMDNFRAIQEYIHGQPVNIESTPKADGAVHNLLKSSFSDELVRKVYNKQKTTTIGNKEVQTNSDQTQGKSQVRNSKQVDPAQLQLTNTLMVSNNNPDVVHASTVIAMETDGCYSVKSTTPAVSLTEPLPLVKQAVITSNDHDRNSKTNEYNIQTRKMDVPLHIDSGFSITASDAVKKPIKVVEHLNGTDFNTNSGKRFLLPKPSTESKTTLDSNNSKQTGSMFKQVEKLGVLKPPPGYAWIVPHTTDNNLLLNKIVCSHREDIPVIKVLQDVDKHENPIPKKKIFHRVIVGDNDGNIIENLASTYGKDVLERKGLFTEKSKQFQPYIEKRNQNHLVISDNESMKMAHSATNSNTNLSGVKEVQRAENYKPKIGAGKKSKVVIYENGTMKVQINLKTKEAPTQSNKENNNPHHDAKTVEPVKNVMYNENKTCRVTPMVRDGNTKPSDNSDLKTRKFVFVNKKGEKIVKTTSKTNQMERKEYQPIKTISQENTNSSNTQYNVNIVHVDILKSANKKSTSSKNESAISTSLSTGNVNRSVVKTNLQRVSTQSSSNLSEQVGGKEKFCAEETAKKIGYNTVEKKQESMKDAIAPVISFDAEKQVWIVQNVDALLNSIKNDKTDLRKSSDSMVECCNNEQEKDKTNEYFRDVNNSSSKENLQTCNEEISALESGKDRSIDEHPNSSAENTDKNDTCQERDTNDFVEHSTENECSTNYYEDLNRNEESTCNFIISDVKSIAPEHDYMWDTKGENSCKKKVSCTVDMGDNSQQDEDSCSDDKNAETIQTENQNSPFNYSKYMPKFQEHFSNRKAKIAKILEEIQENSRRVDMIRAKRQQNERNTHDGNNTEQTSVVIKQEPIENDHKISAADEMNDKVVVHGQSNTTSQNLQRKTFVFKKRKHDHVSPNNKLISDIDVDQKKEETESEGSYHGDENNSCKQSSSLKLAFRKKEGNKYEIIKANNASDQIVYSPHFSKDAPQAFTYDDKNVKRDTLKRKNETGKSVGKNLATSYFKNKIDGSKDKSNSNVCKKRMRTENYMIHDYIDDDDESSTVSDCSLTDEPSIFKCVNSPTFYFDH